MSLSSKIALATAASISVGIIGYVHYKQTSDREKLHEGVLRDIERQQRRKLENTYTLQKQIDLTKQLKDMQQEEEGKPQPQQTAQANETTSPSSEEKTSS